MKRKRSSEELIIGILKEHELAGMIKPPHVADFGDDPCRSREGYAPHRLERLDNRAERPVRNERLDLLFDEIFAFDRLIHGIEIGLKGDLLRRMGNALIGKPDAMLLLPHRPKITAAVTQKKSLDALLKLSHVLYRCLASTNEIAHRFMRFVRHPDRGELACAREARKHPGVTPVSVDAIACGVLAISPKKRTSPVRPASETAIAIVSLGVKLHDGPSPCA
jgi:hypothetical protein